MVTSWTATKAPNVFLTGVWTGTVGHLDNFLRRSAVTIIRPERQADKQAGGGGDTGLRSARRLPQISTGKVARSGLP